MRIHTRRGAAWTAVAALIAAGPAAAQQCPGGQPAYGSIGVGRYECVGGSCSINLRRGEVYAHTFSTEPRLHDIDQSGPGADLLRDGDVLVAVDGKLITTAEGGRRLGGLAPGQDVKLTLRRGGRELNAWLTTRSSCRLPRLDVVSGSRAGLAYTMAGDSTHAWGYAMVPGDSAWHSAIIGADSTWSGHFFPPDSLFSGFVYGDSIAPGFAVTTGDAWVAGFGEGFGGGRAASPAVEFGVELTCGECGWRRSFQGLAFVTEQFPVVAAIEKGGPADAAGLAVGDLLLTVDGLAITSSEAGRRLGSLEAGERIVLEVRRGDRIVDVSIAPRESGERRQRW